MHKSKDVYLVPEEKATTLGGFFSKDTQRMMLFARPTLTGDLARS